LRGLSWRVAEPFRVGDGRKPFLVAVSFWPDGLGHPGKIRRDAIIRGSTGSTLRKALFINGFMSFIDAVVNAAKNGDPTAMRLCVERLVPLRKGRPVVFDLPPVKTAADIAGAVGELARAMAAGELTVEEASAASSVIEMQRRAIETSDIELRLRKLEEGAV
jgi:hypothetical protein